MAGDGGERKQMPKGPSSGNGESKEARSAGAAECMAAFRAGSCEERGGRKEPRGKENSGGKASAGTQPNTENMEDTGCCGSAGRADPLLFFDEDSNHIFPVEQFFGNLDTVQDISYKPSGTEGMSRREYRRRNYYAKDDSDEEQT